MTTARGNGISRRQIIQSSGAAAAIGGFAVLPFAATRAAAQGAWDRETDVVVVGTGTAGTPAAIEAARAGAQVLRLEKVEVVGGNMSHSQGIVYLGGGTQLQIDNGFEDTPEQMATYLEAFMSPWDDPEFITFYCQNSVDHYDWLVGEGVDFGTEAYLGKLITAPEGGGLNFCGNEANYPYSELTPPIPRGHCVNGYGAAMSVALQASADAEPNISTLVNAPVIGLISGDDGRVVGVVAEIDGQQEHILARKGVILASGGYEFNDEMLERTVAPWYGLNPVGSAYRGNTGDGIRMAGAVGARLRNMDQTFTTIFAYPPDPKCQSVLVNQHGRRFLNEASYGAVLGREIVYGQNGIAWLLMDAAIAEEVQAAGGNISEPFATADTVEELAAAIDVPVDFLLAEIDTYNANAEAGVDVLFQKPEQFLTPLLTAPFYAFNYGVSGAVGFMTTGHVEINLDAQVVDQIGDPIPGLYAAGQGGCGLGRLQYNSGIRLGEGSFFGRIAGQQAGASDDWSGGDTFVSIVGPAGENAVAAAEASPVADGADPADAQVTVIATDLAYDTNLITIPADADTVIAVTNEGVIPHDLAVEGTDIITAMAGPGETVAVVVNLPVGEYVYYCTVPGHRAAGMEGTLIVE